MCCVPLCRKITNYDLVWCNELELDQHIVAMASAGGPIGACVCVCVCVCVCARVCVCACVRACVCVIELLPHLLSPAITLDVRLSPPDSSGRLKVQPSVQIRTASGIQLGTAQVMWHVHRTHAYRHRTRLHPPTHTKHVGNTDSVGEGVHCGW